MLDMAEGRIQLRMKAKVMFSILKWGILTWYYWGKAESPTSLPTKNNLGLDSVYLGGWRF